MHNFKELNCWKEELSTVAAEMVIRNKEASLNLSEDELQNVFSEISEATKLNLSNRHELEQFLLYTYKEEVAKKSALKKELNHDLSNITNNIELAPTLEDKELLDGFDEEKNNQKPEYSIIELIKGIIKDLGLGFGWATFYFTVLTSFSGGQTLGKKLLGIKVLQLDGTSLTLWDSFGRYGGYGAGLATGLLGFIQIYWDPNRQAIHDKIASTVVIDLKSSKALS